MKWFDDNKSFEYNRKKYKKLAFKYHPDRPHGDNVIMSEINVEWENLKEIYTQHKQVQEKNSSYPRYRKKPFTRQYYPPFYKYYKQPKSKTPHIIEFKGKKYKGTDEEIFIKIFSDHGYKGLIQFAGEIVLNKILNEI